MALPDFAAGAMENLGCVTFREALLLVDPAPATQGEEQLVADVVAHELAHMWFGDLVTMRWWNGIWLNEAFATFMEIAAVDAYRPDWQRWETFSLERTAAFEVDALASTRPVEYEVVSPADADGMFDVLTYEKGGALLRMLEQYLGEVRFRDGIRQYLAKHSYGNTETQDLWDALEAASGEPVRRIMDTWIWQGGYPLVSVVALGRRDLDRAAGSAASCSATAPGRRHAGTGGPLGDPRAGAPGGSGGHVPAPHAVEVLLDGDEPGAVLDPDAVVVANAGGHGFYRVGYDDVLGPRGRRGAGRAVHHRALQPRRRRLGGGGGGSLDAAPFCDLVGTFSDEPDLAVWRGPVGLAWCDRLLDGEPRASGSGRSCAASSAPPGRAGLAGRSRRGRARRRAARPAHPHAGGPGQRRPRQEHAADGSTGTSMDGGAVDPPRGRPRSSPSRRRRWPTRSATSIRRALPAGRHAPGADPLPLRPGRFRRPGADERTLELPPRPRGADPERALPARSLLRNRDHGDLAWRFVREHWDHANDALPQASHRPHGGPGQDAHPARISRRTWRPSSPSTTSPRPPRRSQQLLERQRVNVSLREREAATLATRFGA